jgi:hypothetical protein
MGASISFAPIFWTTICISDGLGATLNADAVVEGFALFV